MSQESTVESWASTPGIRRSMLGNKRRDTVPELAVRRELHRRGLRYRVDYPLPMSPRRRMDIAFTRQRIAVFIDGCFWHGCPEHGTSPTRNSDYWGPKLARNADRDLDTRTQLEQAGWVVLRFWEHQPPGDIADEIERRVRAGATAADVPR